MGSKEKPLKILDRSKNKAILASTRVKRLGIQKNYFSDIFHFVLSISWIEFFLINSSLYLLMNLFYATLYFVGGDSIINADPNSFWDAFVFSFQTSTTIGYGNLRPATQYADAIVIFDSLSGILFVAITTGLAFAKFSKPTARVLFTENCVIQKYYNKRTLMFRVANARDSHIADASLDVAVIINETSPEGVSMQRLHDLKLVRKKTPIFFISWSVMHVIDEESPLFNLTAKDFVENHVRIIVSLTGIDDWSAQLVHASHIYQPNDIMENKKFADILETQSDGSTIMDYKCFNKLIALQE